MNNAQDESGRARSKMASPTIVTDETFEAQVLKSSLPTLVDFWAIWCGPCKMVAPVVNELAHENSGRLQVMKLDVDENEHTAMRYDVMSIPTLILFKEGQPVERIVGFTSKADVAKKILPHLG
jgi:thioredoxin 1